MNHMNLDCPKCGGTASVWFKYVHVSMDEPAAIDVRSFYCRAEGCTVKERDIVTAIKEADELLAKHRKETLSE